MPKKNKNQIPNYNFTLSNSNITDIISNNFIQGPFYKDSAIIGGIYISPSNLGTVIETIDGQPLTIQGNIVIDGQLSSLDVVNTIHSNGTVNNPSITFSA